MSGFEDWMVMMDYDPNMFYILAKPPMCPMIGEDWKSGKKFKKS